MCKLTYNLLNDGVRTHTYDHANRLTSVVQGVNTYTFAYNGLGGRLEQTANGVTTTYTLDLAGGLTQALADGTNRYVYGLGRIAQDQMGWGACARWWMGGGRVQLARRYEPFGSVLSGGSVGTAYGFTGEWTDGTGLVHLRARYYAPWQ